MMAMLLTSWTYLIAPESTLPRGLRKGLAKIGCTEDQILAVRCVAEAHAEGASEEAFLSFLTGRRERRKAKRLISTHLPFLRLRKCEVEGSKCLRITSKSPKARHISTSAGPATGRDEGKKKKTRHKSKSTLTGPSTGKDTDSDADSVQLREQRDRHVKSRYASTSAANGTDGVQGQKQQDEHQQQDRQIKVQNLVKYMQNLVKRLAHIDTLRKQQADGKKLTEGESAKAAKRKFVFAELRAALLKTKSEEWQKVDLSFLGKYGQGRGTSDTYLDMLVCRDNLKALQDQGKLRHKPTRDPAFAELRLKNDTVLWCPPGQTPDEFVRNSVWVWSDDGSGPFTPAEFLGGNASQQSLKRNNKMSQEGSAETDIAAKKGGGGGGGAGVGGEGEVGLGAVVEGDSRKTKSKKRVREWGGSGGEGREENSGEKATAKAAKGGGREQGEEGAGEGGGGGQEGGEMELQVAPEAQRRKSSPFFGDSRARARSLSLARARSLSV
jgi:hypothetical protein